MSSCRGCSASRCGIGCLLRLLGQRCRTKLGTALFAPLAKRLQLSGLIANTVSLNAGDIENRRLDIALNVVGDERDGPYAARSIVSSASSSAAIR